MRESQRGVSLGGLLIGLVVLIFAALLGFKLLPPYMEFRTIKNAIDSVSRDRAGGSVSEIRKAFDARQAIDDFTAVGGKDLEITKEGSEVVISFAYRKEVPLFWNLGVYMDFTANSKGQ